MSVLVVTNRVRLDDAVRAKLYDIVLETVKWPTGKRVINPTARYFQNCFLFLTMVLHMQV